MWIIATENLKIFLPDSSDGHRRTQVAPTGRQVPRLFETKKAAAICLSHWMKGPYKGFWEEDYGWEYEKQTDPQRKIKWGPLLAPREVKLESVS